MGLTWMRRARRFAGHLRLYDFGRWLVLAMLVGVVTGLGAAFLTWGIGAVSDLLHGQLVGFSVPGHGDAAATSWQPPLRPWWLLIILPAAGAIVGLLVTRFAPETEGHGTDAVIRSFHREQSLVRKRVGPLKLISSMITIGSGGSAGREGPVAQVGAGFGSLLARILKLPVRDRRVLLIAGVAGGVGGMFRAPLGGALFAIEVLYSENEFESEALIPAIISAIVSYVVNASLTGWDSVFHTVPVSFTRPIELIPYVVLGFFLAIIGIVYVKVFYGIRDLFARLRVPGWTKPAIGGLLLAPLAMVLPQVLGGGYGWLQLTLDGELPFKLLAVLVPAKILATSLTIASGGSGGVFAPSLIIGGMSGAVFADLAARVAPDAVPSAGACVLVGMGGFFSGVAKVPIASLIMVAEMSGSYRLLVPMMLVGSVSFLLTRSVSIYEQQVPGKVDSPTHLGEFQVDLLSRLTVQDVPDSEEPVRTVARGTPFPLVLELVAEAEQNHFPVLDPEGRMIGLFTTDDVRRVMTSPEVWSVLVADDLGMSGPSIPYVRSDDTLLRAVRLITAHRATALPVLDGPPPARLERMISDHEVLRRYDQAMEELRESVEG